ncbi:hypothetical protein EW026_g361 [Hermanssonia centrifuga]|uniref:Mitochondrial import inner membrane translocase subunit Tim21 n=1 Tax=Hermanssonia centrifuga TaxID=98765 RepID=A0A4S4KVT4_9APHY|nr:hypothetical protein EW026_g361 [Hermanssonia centrifuga]
MPSTENEERRKRYVLSAAYIFLRTTARTTNLLVILFGAGFSAMLVYALTSELFSKNSPTVLYGQACDLIKSSPKVAQYLPGSLVFHNNPPTSIRPRHRNDRVASQITRDSSGREHMLLNFFVQAKPGSYSADENPSWYSSTVDWTKRAVSKLSEMSLDEVTDAAGQHASEVMDSCKRMFRFLTGDPLPSTQPVSSPVPEVTEEKKSSSWKSGAIGLFSVLRSSTKEPKESGNDVPDEHAYTDGEVHADLVMNDQGLYEFRYLRIDIPDSQIANPKRIFVVSSSGPGTRDSRWR